MANFKQAEEYDRRKAIASIGTSMERWVPTLLERPADLVDAVEGALKEKLPGYHVRVSVERIEAGLE